MESNIAFMHYEPTPFFVPRLPFRSPLSIKKKGYSGDDGEGLSCGDNDLGTSRFFFSFNDYGYY